MSCSAQGSFVIKLCSTISEVTCRKELGRIRSCLMSNEDSLFFASSVTNGTVICNDAEQVKGNCRLSFSLDYEVIRKSGSHLQKNAEFTENQFVISNSIQPINHGYNIYAIIFVGFGVGISICIVLCILLCICSLLKCCLGKSKVAKSKIR